MHGITFELNCTKNFKPYFLNKNVGVQMLFIPVVHETLVLRKKMSESVINHSLSCQLGIKTIFTNYRGSSVLKFIYDLYDFY